MTATGWPPGVRSALGVKSRPRVTPNRQGPDQRRVEDGEHRGGRAEAEAERGHGQHHEAQVLGQHSHAVDEVVPHRRSPPEAGFVNGSVNETVDQRPVR